MGQGFTGTEGVPRCSWAAPQQGGSVPSVVVGSPGGECPQGTCHSPQQCARVPGGMMGSPGSTRGPKAVTVSPGAMRGSPRDLSVSPGGVLGPQGVCHHPQGVCQRVRQGASVSRSPASVPRERARFPGGVPGPPAGRAAFPGTVPGSRGRARCGGRWQVPGAGWRREIRRWRGGPEPLSGAGSPGCSQEMGEARGGRAGVCVCAVQVCPHAPRGRAPTRRQ